MFYHCIKHTYDHSYSYLGPVLNVCSYRFLTKLFTNDQDKIKQFPAFPHKSSTIPQMKTLFRFTAHYHTTMCYSQAIKWSYITVCQLKLLLHSGNCYTIVAKQPICRELHLKPVLAYSQTMELHHHHAAETNPLTTLCEHFLAPGISIIIEDHVNLCN